MHEQLRCKGYDKNSKLWVIGYFIKRSLGLNGCSYIIISEVNDKEYVVEKESVGSFIGYFGKERRGVYTGDVIKHRYGIGVIYFDKDSYNYNVRPNGFTDWASHEWYDTNNIEVIGNIFSNPELEEILTDKT